MQMGHDACEFSRVVTMTGSVTSVWCVCVRACVREVNVRCVSFTACSRVLLVIMCSSVSSSDKLDFVVSVQWI